MDTQGVPRSRIFLFALCRCQHFVSAAFAAACNNVFTCLMMRGGRHLFHLWTENGSLCNVSNFFGERCQTGQSYSGKVVGLPQKLFTVNWNSQIEGQTLFAIFLRPCMHISTAWNAYKGITTGYVWPRNSLKNSHVSLYILSRKFLYCYIFNDS